MMNNANIPKSAERIEREQAIVWFCGLTLRRVMDEHAIDNIKLAELAGVDKSYVSRARNGTLNQRNYVILIRGLPVDARKDYLDRLYFAPIPEKLAPEVRKKIADRAKKNRERRPKHEDN